MDFIATHNLHNINYQIHLGKKKCISVTEPLSWLSGNRELKRAVFMTPLKALKNCLSRDVEFSDITKRKQENCELKRIILLPLCVGFLIRQGKLAQNLASIYLHRGTQINEHKMDNVPASTANILFRKKHTPEYLHNQKHTCSFNYMKIM